MRDANGGRNGAPPLWPKATPPAKRERDRVQALLSQYARRDPETGELILDRDAEERLRNGNSNGQG